VIEAAYADAEAAGIALWCQDEAGPYQAIPHPGADWHRTGNPTRQPQRGGTAKVLTLFRPATGQVRARGVHSASHAVLHPWRKAELLGLLEHLAAPPLPVCVPLSKDHLVLRTGYRWWWSYEHPKPPPALRLILLWDHLKGHLSYDVVRWLLHLAGRYAPVGLLAE
jgi:hypothetical protein